MRRSPVALVGTTPETVDEDLRRSLVLADFRGRAAEGRRWVVVADLAWASDLPGANTTPWQLAGALRALRDEHVGGDRIQVVATGRGSDGGLTRGALAAVLAAAKAGPMPLGNRVLVPHDESWRTVPTALPEGPRIPALLPGADVLLLPAITTHAILGVGAAMAQLLTLVFGEVAVPRRWVPGLVPDALRILASQDIRVFTLADGTVCGDGAGPRTIRPSVQNVLVAGADPVAVDAIAARVLGLDPRGLPVFRRCAEAGYGDGDPTGIEVRGEGPVEAAGAAAVPDDTAARLERIAQERAGLPRRLTRTAQDRIWFPLVGRRMARRYARTPWGRLAHDLRERGSA